MKRDQEELVLTENQSRNYCVTRICHMASLVAMTTRARLVIMTKVNQNLAKMQVAWNGGFYSNAVVANLIVDLLSSRNVKETSLIMHDITILGQAMDNG